MERRLGTSDVQITPVLMGTWQAGKKCGIAACAVAYADFWSAYEEIFPVSRHQAVGQKSGKTNLPDAI